MSAANVAQPTNQRQPKERPALAAWRARIGFETGGPVLGPPAPLSPAAELALLAVRELRRELRVRPERDDPQAALIDRLTEDEVLELLGPSWDEMSGGVRRRPPLARTASEVALRRWWKRGAA